MQTRETSGAADTIRVVVLMERDAEPVWPREGCPSRDLSIRSRAATPGPVLLPDVVTRPVPPMAASRSHS